MSHDTHGAVQAFEGVLDEIEDYLENRQDIVDGSHGEQRPNAAMSLLTELRWWRGPAMNAMRSETASTITPAEAAEVLDLSVNWPGISAELADKLARITNAAPQAVLPPEQKPDKTGRDAGDQQEARPAGAAPSSALSAGASEKAMSKIVEASAPQIEEAARNMAKAAVIGVGVGPLPSALSAEVRRFQGGLTNAQLAEAWEKKLPGVTPTDRELSAFAIGIEVGETLTRSATAATWIPVTERLPDDRGPWLVYGEDGQDVTTCHPSWWNTKDPRGSEFDGPEITHWMPLPEVPAPDSTEARRG